MASSSPTFGTDEILWYDNGKWGEAGYALANPNGKTWTNNGVLANRSPIWALAVEVFVRYEGDAQPGLPVRGHALALQNPMCSPGLQDARSDVEASVFNEGESPEFSPSPQLGGDHFQGLDQSPQRSR
jgi:hypothetical protein